MRERIILAPGIKGHEFIKGLASNGVSTINVKLMSAGELARYALMKSGITIKEEFLSSKEECALIARAVAGEKYFGKATYSDIKEIAAAVRRMRMLADGDEATKLKDILDKGIFTEKNEAIYNTYVKYIDIIKSENAIDQVVLLRKAINEANEMDADFSIVTECDINPLEKALINKLSGGKAQVVSICDLYNKGSKPLKIENYRNCYGSPNEVETIINDIYKNKRIDSVTVALTDTVTYSQLFFDYALLYDIPVTFGCGIPITNSNPAKLLNLYYNWIVKSFYGKEALNTILNSSVFDKKAWNKLFEDVPEDFDYKLFYQLLSGLRLTNNASVNKERIGNYKKALSEEESCLEASDLKAGSDFIKRKACTSYLEKASQELALPAEEFIKKYSRIRRDTSNNATKLLMHLDMAAASAIYEELGVIRNAGIDQSADDVIVNVLSISVGRESSREGALHVTDINGAISTIRKNMYIAGLSASKFPGSPKENYLLLDADLKLFGDESLSYTSEGKIKRKHDNLMALLQLANSLDSSIYLSYAGQNVSELKKDNASSVLFELYKEETGSNVTAKDLESHVEKVEYFEPSISVTKEIGKAYNEDKNVHNEYTLEQLKALEEAMAHADEEIAEEIEEEECIVEDLESNILDPIDREWSPSAINKYLACPRRFMLDYVMGIKEPDEEKPFEIISAAGIGTLAHTLMEVLADTRPNLDDFTKVSGEYFDRYLMQNPPLVRDGIDEAKEQFLEIMETAYKMDPGREVALKEEDIHCVHSTGVKLHGYPDRVEKLDDGTYLIVDFKSGRNVDHEEDDIYTCLQVVIYAYLMEQKGYKVSGGEFRYIRLGETVRCKYDDDIKAQLTDILEQFKSDLDSFNVAKVYAGEEDNCKYCGYKNSICRV